MTLARLVWTDGPARPEHLVSDEVVDAIKTALTDAPVVQTAASCCLCIPVVLDSADRCKGCGFQWTF